ncbi:MAG: pyrophosphohydrolase [Alphaproteobacteria bacterium]|nr:pyrophosphohydrolase [Alphaproteobacteria bacterium]
MQELRSSPTLSDFQRYVMEMKQERGFNTTDKFYECCLLAEECGELISAVRKNNKKGSVGSGSQIGNVAEELADVFIYICSLANMHGIDLEQAFRNKEEINKTRTWERL